MLRFADSHCWLTYMHAKYIAWGCVHRALSADTRSQISGLSAETNKSARVQRAELD